MSYKTDFIEFMVRSGVLRFGDFTTKSGRKSPYFVNTGNYRTGAQMSKLGKYYAECLKNNVGEDFDVLFGPAYKGIPLATVTACALYTEYGIDKPYCFNRKEVKDHGEGGNMVGAKLSDGDRVVNRLRSEITRLVVARGIGELRAFVRILLVFVDIPQLRALAGDSEQNRTAYRRGFNYSYS